MSSDIVVENLYGGICYTFRGYGGCGFAGLVVKVLGMSTSVASNHRTIVVGTDPMEISPYHHPYLFGTGPIQYGRIPKRTYGRNWQGPKGFEA
jgi:hypothetical protein